MKRLLLQRLYHRFGPTIGAIFLDGQFECWTLEDPPQQIKIPGRTRIPAGEYQIKVRTEGGMHADYSQRFPEEHEGMLHLQNVNNYKYIYIHIGNTERDTEGCILVGKLPYLDRVAGSTNTYFELYDKIIREAQEGRVKIKVQDEQAFMEPSSHQSLSDFIRKLLTR